jgi:hypothetical protein
MIVDDYLEFRLLKYIIAVADAGTFTAVCRDARWYPHCS